MSNQLKNTIMKTNKQKKYIEDMFNLLNADEVIPHLVTKIDEEIQLKIFDLPDEEAAEIMREYVKHDYWLCDEAQLKVFGLPNVAEILLEYVKHGWALCKEAQFKVFDLPDEKAVEIILEYTKHGGGLCPEARKRYDELMAKSAKG